jgi:hypothetical protein
LEPLRLVAVAIEKLAIGRGFLGEPLAGLEIQTVVAYLSDPA